MPHTNYYFILPFPCQADLIPTLTELRIWTTCLLCHFCLALSLMLRLEQLNAARAQMAASHLVFYYLLCSGTCCKMDMKKVLSPLWFFCFLPNLLIQLIGGPSTSSFANYDI